MASADFKSRISGVPRAGFESPTVVILEDFDLWDLPDFDPQLAENPVQGLLQMQLSRGAREALALIQTALESPEATVLISASEPSDIDPFFWELIGSQYQIIDIELPSARERREIWREVQAQHPSTRGLDATRMVELSRGLSRFEILAIASEAVEEGRVLPKIASAQLRPARWFRVWRTSSHWTLRSIVAWRIWRLKSCAGVLPISTICWRTNG